ETVSGKRDGHPVAAAPRQAAAGDVGERPGRAAGRLAETAKIEHDAVLGGAAVERKGAAEADRRHCKRGYRNQSHPGAHHSLPFTRARWRFRAPPWRGYAL